MVVIVTVLKLFAIHCVSLCSRISTWDFLLLLLLWFSFISCEHKIMTSLYSAIPKFNTFILFLVWTCLFPFYFCYRLPKKYVENQKPCRLFFALFELLCCYCYYYDYCYCYFIIIEELAKRHRTRGLNSFFYFIFLFSPFNCRLRNWRVTLQRRPFRKPKQTRIWRHRNFDQIKRSPVTHERFKADRKKTNDETRTLHSSSQTTKRRGKKRLTVVFKKHLDETDFSRAQTEALRGISNW